MLAARAALIEPEKPNGTARSIDRPILFAMSVLAFIALASFAVPT